jgi:co-chaperonin GroES (HSP10)
MVKPLYDMLLVKVNEEEYVSSGGVLIVNASATEYAEGTVVEVGTGYKTDTGLKPLTVSVGDDIIYRKGVEVEIVDNNEKYMLVSENTVMAIRQ